jgi:hypothetical protein
MVVNNAFRPLKRLLASNWLGFMVRLVEHCRFPNTECS